jgi:cobalt/nickel transport system ATP-binding protein
LHHNPISIDNLSYCYPEGIQALKAINLQIAATEKVAIIGANGSGKSTLLLHLNGILLPQQGKIVIGENLVIPQNLTAIRNFVGLVFQNPDDQLFMPTVWEDIAFGLLNQGIRGDDLKVLVAEALVAVGLDVTKYRDRLSHHLSGGEKKRVAIAGILAMQPQVLVFDEPSAQLDPRSRRHLIQLLQTRHETQIIATHDLDLALELCDRTVILSEGEIVYDGETKKVLSDRLFLLAHSLEMPLKFG